MFNWQTRQTWRISDRPGHFLLNPLAINAEQLVLSENTSNTAGSAQYIDRIVQLATSQLSRVEAGW